MKRYTTVFPLLVCGWILFAVSCKKKDYLTDDGVHTAKTSLNTYDYLKSNQYHLFDTFLLVVDRFNMKDELLNAKSVFCGHRLFDQKVHGSSAGRPPFDQ